MAAMISKSLTGKLHLAGHEPIVSRLLCSVLNSDRGPIVLSALLNCEVAASTKIVAEPEVRGDSGRYDILVARSIDGLLNLTIIELKVAATQGDNQLLRYRDDAESERLLRVLPSKFAVMPLASTRELVYLTISAEEVPLGVIHLTYRELQKRIDDSNAKNADVSELDWLLFRDVLFHLGTEYGADVDFLSSVDAGTTIGQIREAYSADRLFLQKKLGERICQVVRENLDSGKEWETYPYIKPTSGGCECGFYRTEWKQEASQQYPGWEVHFNTDDLKEVILQNKARTRLHVQFVPNPYQDRKSLNTGQQEWLESARVTLRNSVQAQISEMDQGCCWRIQKYKWQFASTSIEIESDNTLGQLAAKYWQAAVQLTPMIDQALKSTIGQ